MLGGYQISFLVKIHSLGKKTFGCVNHVKSLAFTFHQDRPKNEIRGI